MPEISATDAARHFSDLLDAVEHRGERFTIIRRGNAVAHLEPVRTRRGSEVKDLLREYEAYPDWSDDLADSRRLVQLQYR